MSEVAGYWDAEQAGYLHAMGYSVLALHTDTVEETVMPPPVAPVLATAPASVQHPIPVDHPEARAGRDEAVRTMAPSTPLERALLAATGQTRRAEARAVLERLNVDPAALRDSPSAKRALWPLLRALRNKRR